MFETWAAEAAEIELEQRRLDARRARILADLDRTGVCDVEAGLRTGTWWARTHGLGERECRARLRIAAKSDTHFGLTLDALEAGRVGWSHLAVLCRVANPRIVDQLAALQDALVVLAETLMFEEWVREVEAIAYRLDVEGGHDPDRDRDPKVHVSPTLGGAAIGGWLTDDLSVPLLEALEAKTDEFFRRAQQDRKASPELPIPKRSELRAFALAELIRIGSGRTLDDTKPAAPECTLAVDPSRGTVTTIDGQQLSRMATVLLTNDAFWSLLRYSDGGAIINHGRASRHVPPHLRKLVKIRDGGCVFPGCRQHVDHCDAHHVIWWERHGETNSDNIAMLCRYHHRMIHRKGWTMIATDGEWFAFISPAGDVIASQRHHRQRQQSQTTRAP